MLSGNEYGADLSSKKNFTMKQVKDARKYFNEILDDDFATLAVHVLDNGEEVDVASCIDGELTEKWNEYDI